MHCILHRGWWGSQRCRALESPNFKIDFRTDSRQFIMLDVALLAQTVAQFRQVWKKSWNATQITVGTSFWTPFHSHVQNYIVSQPLKRNVYGEVVRIDSTITLHLSVRAMKSQVLHAGEIWNWIVCPEMHSWKAEHSLVQFLMHDVLSLVKASQTCVSILDISPFLTMKIRISFTLKKLCFSLLEELVGSWGNGIWAVCFKQWDEMIDAVIG